MPLFTRSWAAFGFSLILAAGCGGTADSSSGSDGSTSNSPDGGLTPGDGSVVPPGPTPVESLVSQSLFEQLFLHRGTSPCQGAFYTYQSFIDAAKSFPDFAQQGTLDDRKRELAAFFANASHETTGGWATAPDGQYAWGLCWINEGGAVTQTADYCVASTEYPCAAGKKYFGRGPLQISYNYNYGQAGQALGASLLAQPELVASDPVLAWKTALWFWMTTQQPKPSCHDVITGRWTPTSTDTSAGRTPGFGMTINIINGGVECNQPTPDQVKDRVGFYSRYTQIFGVDPGANLTCDKMQSY